MKKLLPLLNYAILISVIIPGCGAPSVNNPEGTFTVPDTFLYQTLIENYVPKGISKIEVFNEENHIESTSTYDSLGRLCKQQSNSLFGVFRCYKYKGTSLFPSNKMNGSDVSTALSCYSKFDPKTNRLYFADCVAGKEKLFPQNIESCGYYQYNANRNSLTQANTWSKYGAIEETTFSEISSALSTAKTWWTYKKGTLQSEIAIEGSEPFQREVRIFNSGLGVDSITTQMAFSRDTTYGILHFQKGLPTVQVYKKVYKKKSRINQNFVYTIKSTIGKGAACNCFYQ